MSAELVRAVCNKPRWHTLAVVSAAPGGNHEVRFWQAVTVGPREYEGHELTTTLDELEGRMAYCRACRKPYLFDASVLRRAIAQRVPRVVLEPRGFIEDPMRILRQRHGASDSTP